MLQADGPLIIALRGERSLRQVATETGLDRRVIQTWEDGGSVHLDKFYRLACYYGYTGKRFVELLRARGEISFGQLNILNKTSSDVVGIRAKVRWSPQFQNHWSAV